MTSNEALNAIINRIPLLTSGVERYEELAARLPECEHASCHEEAYVELGEQEEAVIKFGALIADFLNLLTRDCRANRDDETLKRVMLRVHQLEQLRMRVHAVTVRATAHRNAYLRGMN